MSSENSAVNSLIVWAYPARDTALDQNEIKRSFKAESYDCLFVHESTELQKILETQTVSLVFISEDFTQHAIDFVRNSRSHYTALWIYVLVRPNFDNRLRAMSAGVKTVLQMPVPSDNYLAVYKSYEKEVLANRKKSNSSSLNLNKTTAKPVSPDKDSSAQLFKPSINYEAKRPHWTKMVERLDPASNQASTQLRSQTQQLLSDLMAEIGQGTLDMISLHMSKPPESRVEFVRSLVSSDSKKLGSVLRLEWLPEVSEALEKVSPVILKNLNRESLQKSGMPLNKMDRLLSEVHSMAAIPMFRGDKIEGMLSVRLASGIDEETESLLKDLASFSPKLLETFLTLDFLHRIYKGTEYGD